MRGKMDGFLIVYNITYSYSFKGVPEFLQLIEKSDLSNYPKILIGNKCDLENQREVSKEKGKEFADKIGIPFFETSAKENINIDEAFEKLIKMILETNPEPNFHKREKSKKKKGCAFVLN
ncbi:small gtp binding protein rab8 [Anaeramoeba ignava]|uniref:Small gtp binding protein rab8 n=1 Tax=Anaeramoeba ignava TaxID=1746090 RepID=A0A9Q0LXR4_ANAIG|nr:small gtp binding protein rab8 [Anaeramoeba ignava]